VSLRARLVLVLVAVAAAGLLVAAGATYLAQRDFLLNRVDGQARAAVPVVDRALAREGLGGRGGRGGRGYGPPGFGPPPGFDGDGDGGRGPDVPLGTFGQRRTAAGRVLGSVVLSYDQRDAETPDLPADLPDGRPVTSDDGDFRVVAAQGGTLVVAVPLTEVSDSLARLLRIEAVVIGGVLALLAALSWLLVRLGLRPLDRIGQTAGAIAAGSLSERVAPADGRTEVGRLGLALNAMLDRLERAFAEREASEERLRRFLADASHELRTPLSSIRGYAELFRLGAVPEGEEQARALRRIEDEAARMGVLVEDLLVLARLDELREPDRAPVDLAALAEDAVADARATAPDRDVSLTLTDPAVVEADADALRQVLANLLRNAVTHTPAGTPIEVDVRPLDEMVVLTVRDHGPGLPTDRPQELFERFWRAEGGRERGRAGAGLGLAIVAGIVEAHGGRVSAGEAPGGGAQFAVALPAAAVAAAAVAG
jgi:two-component system OmpR family sensor kinase